MSYFQKPEQWIELLKLRKLPSANVVHELSRIPPDDHDIMLELIQPLINRDRFNIVNFLYKIDADKRKAVMDLLFPYINNFTHVTQFRFFEVAAKINDIAKLRYGMYHLTHLPELPISSEFAAEILEDFCFSSFDSIELAFKILPNIRLHIVGKVARLSTIEGNGGFLEKYPPIDDKYDYEKIIKLAYNSSFGK